jgi:hypothetical protein
VNNNNNNNNNNNTTASKSNNSFNINNNDDNSNSNLTNTCPLPTNNLPVLSNHQSNQIQLYSNMPYRHLKCDACDASDATDAISKRTETNHKAKTKAEEVGLPEIPCMFCGYKDPIEFDLSLHYLEKHRQDLIRLPIGKSPMDNRADYAVELSMKRLLESFEDEDEDENNYDDMFEIEEEEE